MSWVSRRLMRGKRNAAVLPEPCPHTATKQMSLNYSAWRRTLTVCAQPITSRLPATIGSAYFWTGVGWSKPAKEMFEANTSCSLASSNVLMHAGAPSPLTSTGMSSYLAKLMPFCCSPAQPTSAHASYHNSRLAHHTVPSLISCRAPLSDAPDALPLPSHSIAGSAVAKGAHRRQGLRRHFHPSDVLHRHHPTDGRRHEEHHGHRLGPTVGQPQPAQAVGRLVPTSSHRQRPGPQLLGGESLRGQDRGLRHGRGLQNVLARGHPSQEPLLDGCGELGERSVRLASVPPPAHQLVRHGHQNGNPRIPTCASL